MQRRLNADSGVSAAKSISTELNEAALLSRIAEGDRRAFETLYRGYFPRLIRFLDRMTRNVPLMEEIVNDTMLVVWQKAFTFDSSSKVSTWIFAIAYRKALKGLRVLDEPMEFDPDRCADEISRTPDEEMEHLEMHKIVGQALDALPIEQRAVVCFTYYHAMDYAEIADIMDCPVNTVKTRMFHARRRLKALLAGRMEEKS